jgi:pilus assembly protein CpaF
MSDIDIPMYVARAQVAGAIHLVVQIARFSEDSSRRITRITEAIGLGDANEYQMRDLFACQPSARSPEGRLMLSLDPTGEQPSFAHAPFEQGLKDFVRLSQPLWSRSATTKKRTANGHS